MSNATHGDGRHDGHGAGHQPDRINARAILAVAGGLAALALVIHVGVSAMTLKTFWKSA